MNNRVAFTGFNNVTVTNMNFVDKNGSNKFYKRLCLQLNDNDGKDLSENLNLVKRFPDKMRSNYLRIDSSAESLRINGKDVDFYGENGSLFKQIGNLLNRVKENRYKITYTKNYLKSNKVLQNMTCCFKEKKFIKPELNELKKQAPNLGNITDTNSIAGFTDALSKVCHDFYKISRFLN